MYVRFVPPWKKIEQKKMERNRGYAPPAVVFLLFLSRMYFRKFLQSMCLHHCVDTYTHMD